MSHTTEHHAKTPSSNTGLFATLRALLRGKGNRAPSSITAAPTPPSRAAVTRRAQSEAEPQASALTASAAHSPLRSASVGAAPSADLPAKRSSHPSRLAALLLASIIATFALTATPASAFPPPRSYAVQITGIVQPGGIVVDSAGNVWIAETAHNVNEDHVFEYGPYPSPTQTTQIGEQTYGVSGDSLALDSINGDLFVTESNALRNDLYVFENGTGPLLETLEIGSTGTYVLSVATDNSSPSTGRIYVSDEHSVQAFEPNRTKHNFSGEAPYISGNEITGTPSGSFVEPLNIATDNKGNIYEVDRGKRVVDEFNPEGIFLREYTGAGAPGGFGGEVTSVAVDPTTGNVLITERSAGVIDEFEPSGGYLGQITGSSEGAPFGSDSVSGLAFNSSGDLYVRAGYESPVDIFIPNPVYPTLSYRPISNLTRNSVTLNASIGPHEGGSITECRFEYGTNTEYTLGSEQCLNGTGEPVGTSGSPITEETEVHADISEKLRGNTTYHYRLVLHNASGTLEVGDRHFETPPAVSGLETPPANSITNVSATLSGSFTGEEMLETEYYFEYGTSPNFGHKTPVGAVPGPASGTQPENVSTLIENLVPNTTYHYRFFAKNKYGTTPGKEKELTTFQPPTIEAFSSSEVTATSAILHASINPQGFETTCHFEYGTTTAYGQSAPCPRANESLPPEDIGKSNASMPVKVQLENLQRGVTYHFRVVAHNQWGTVTSEDQNFEFFPPSCPNSAVRQQTGSPYLPDCRAYELVSPGEANGTLLFPGGPNTGQATSPSRFSFVGAFSALPGQNVIGTVGDLYVATRTDTGWVSHYVGLPGDQAGCVGGPPTNPLNHVDFGGEIQNTVLADPAMSRFLDWSDGTGMTCILGNQGTGDANYGVDQPSVAPYLWNSDGTPLAHLPTDLASTPGAAAAFTCPEVEVGGEPGSHGQIPECSGEVAASGDLTHLVFSSNSLQFAPGGLTEAPGSAYDDDLATGTVTLISKLPGAKSIPQDPSFASVPRGDVPGTIVYQPGGKEEFLRFPAVSTDGSHILISTATAPTESCQAGASVALGTPCRRYTDTPIHLYMSVDDAPAYNVSENQHTHENVGVNYVGVTPDGSKVYFTSEEHLTGEDTHHGGAGLYMWSAEKAKRKEQPLTLISKGDNEGNPGEPGNTAACNPALASIKLPPNGNEEEALWTHQCGIVPYSGYSYTFSLGGIGGNGISDSAIAENGDIYFYSPEQLDGDRGVLNQQNLYDYRDGRVQYVTTFAPGNHCHAYFLTESELFACPDGPIARFEVAPDDSHMAFVTADRLTSYENAGHLEMYSYTPSTETLVCDSCNPDGQPATADVEASQDGLFLTDDGRTFFSTTESLVPQDTNEGEDVYEFVDGRPQLITPGTGTATLTGHTYVSATEVPGLIGVSANGTDVYFSTFDTLLSEDHNGNFLKFYDARTDGGFPQPPPVQPCAAAEECHGPGTERPELGTPATLATDTGGNATPEPHKHHRKKHKGKRRHRRAGHKHGGSK